MMNINVARNLKASIDSWSELEEMISDIEMGRWMSMEVHVTRGLLLRFEKEMVNKFKHALLLNKTESGQYFVFQYHLSNSALAMVYA